MWVRLGSSFEITCDATGVPQPIISWRRLHTSGALETLAETTTRRQLRIDVTSREMGGTYQCVANNGVEEPAVAGVNLYVNCKRGITFPVRYCIFNLHSSSLYRYSRSAESSDEHSHQDRISHASRVFCLGLSKRNCSVVSSRSTCHDGQSYYTYRCRCGGWFDAFFIHSLSVSNRNINLMLFLLIYPRFRHPILPHMQEYIRSTR